MNRAGLIGFAILSIFFLMAVAPWIFAPYDPYIRFTPYAEPGTDHILGTNDMGHDILSELIYSARASLFVGFVAAILATLLGVIIGIIAGYYRGWIEDLLMGVTDIFLMIPKIPMIIIIAAFLGSGIWVLILVFGAFSWTAIARIARSKVLQIRESGFVLSARCLGFSNRFIMAREIAPNLTHIVFPKFMLLAASAMITEASISFIGLGDPSMKSWGVMLSFAFTKGGLLNGMWWWYIPPGIAISVCVMAIALIGYSREKGADIGVRG
ncbi:peptide ABC transporter permease [Methanocalculus chunghsingensis]|uniref:Peptide ABC transporter permease n=1 Tax=Methanocalculus chunghsingensis TaxID=156457 RepID=A0A8J8B5A5_9EURY|nr:ABC transporter permease [Methanocalculus chunghsingensis]MBR1369566.1 peptide ABC transporter permease [Methanocalculus chunghsingensis]